jgi:four helix bundle protein
MIQLRISDCGLKRIKNHEGDHHMNQSELKRRTKVFAVNIVRLFETLPQKRAVIVLGRQILRSGTSVGANYRAACRSKSAAEFIAKMGTVEEEIDETMYWLELLIEVGILKAEQAEAILKEANELLAIVVASIKTARKKNSH